VQSSKTSNARNVKARRVDRDEIDHLGAIADSLAFTIEQMAAIDKAYRAAFPGQG
jgi:hypothetical protein